MGRFGGRRGKDKMMYFYYNIRQHIFQNNSDRRENASKYGLAMMGLWQEIEAQVGERNNECGKTSYSLSSFQVLGRTPGTSHSFPHLILTSVWISDKRKPTPEHSGCLRS